MKNNKKRYCIVFYFSGGFFIKIFIKTNRNESQILNDIIEARRKNKYYINESQNRCIDLSKVCYFSVEEVERQC